VWHFGNPPRPNTRDAKPKNMPINAEAGSSFLQERTKKLWLI
jgi:hypothetical protein